MTLAGIMHSTGKDDWGTPPAFFDRLDEEYNFVLDACAAPWNTKLSRHYTLDQNGLSLPWETWTWCNPPYSDIYAWYEKAYGEALIGNSSVVLTFARTDTRAFHEFALCASKITFIKGRIKFIDPVTQAPKAPAPAPSILVEFDAARLGACDYTTMSAG
jgi:site-specific DNA-methyltransferase (adenine-specific)